MKIRNLAIVTFLIIGSITGMLVLMQLNEPITRTVIKNAPRKWVDIAGPSPQNMASGDASGILGIYIKNHWANGSYWQNLSTGQCWAYSTTTLNASLTGEVPRNTAFDIVVKCRFNRTDVVNGTTMMITFCRANITCADLSIGALTAMSERNITNQATGKTLEYMFVNYYMNNSGSGYTIGADEKVNVTALKVQVYR